MSERQERFEDGKRKAAKVILEAANILAETSCIAPDEENDDFVNFLASTANKLRDTADKIDPPREDWPDKVVPFSKAKKRRK